MAMMPMKAMMLYLLVSYALSQPQHALQISKRAERVRAMHLARSRR
jgi:hypothetical protein